MTALAPHLTAFFQERLPVERRASSHTSDSYAYAFKLLLQHASERLKVAPSHLQLEQLDAPLIVSFLNHLETARANGPSSRNVRLAAIKSTHLVRHLTVEEMQAVLDAPEPTGWDGLRDRAMLHLCFAGGLRVSELVGLRLADLTLQPHASIVVHGKGRRERSLPLWKITATALRAWLAIRGPAPTPELFLNARGQAMTRSGFEYVLDKHVKTATKACPSLSTKRVSPHVLRHTCALTVLQATKDL
ncbi:MAG: integrase, partial [Acidobacteria bacterium]